VDPRASGFAMTRRDSLDVPRLSIKQINLVERIASFTLTLENHLLAVSAEISLPGTRTFEGQLPY
jgi:hypothetical protein